MTTTKEKAATCCQKNCDAEPTHRVFWPGEGPQPMCATHALTAQRIGAALGSTITAEPLTAEKLAELNGVTT